MKRERMSAQAPTLPRALQKNLTRERVALGVYTLTLVIANPGHAFCFAILPWTLANACLVAINLFQHHACDPASKYGNSRNFVGPVLNWFLVNNGYHTAHHLEPARHWSALPAAHARIADQIPAHLNEPSLPRYLWRFLRARSSDKVT